MNAIEIEQAISELAEQDFDADNFPFAFLEAFGNKATTIKRLRSTTKSSTNASDIEGGVLQRTNIHIAVCAEGEVTSVLGKLKQSPATTKAKAKFILATDGSVLEAEDLLSGDTIACNYNEFPNYFGFFLPLAGISTVGAIRNNPIDIQATSRLNRLYVELLKDNESWTDDAGRHNMNQFMTRLIFCFFAEDTEIFSGDNLFTGTLEQMTSSRTDNTQEVIVELFRAMDTKPEDREAANLPRWAVTFPHVNGGLFAGNKEIPSFSRIARSYLLHVGKLDWKAINPDIFGSMIQAVADDEERGELGMHYTSVPNILKVLNPLFLDSLREQLEQAGDNPRKLLNLRKRLANIRVFDPACGSGNFLVIAYIQLREIEAEILKRRGEVTDSGYVTDKSWLKLENFYGIELKDFAVEVARLSLLIAEFQCDVRFIGQKEATSLVLPLRKTGQIFCGNALQIDWLVVCPASNDSNETAETYICGNPPYLGSTWQSKEQKSDLQGIFAGRTKSWKSLDYVSGWFMKAVDYGVQTNTASAFVSTNSICQGQQVPILWPLIFEAKHEIIFAHTNFKWANLATHNAGVTVVIIGVSSNKRPNKQIYSVDLDKQIIVKSVSNINAYLVPSANIIVEKSRKPLSSELPLVHRGSIPVDGGNLYLDASEKEVNSDLVERKLIRPCLGAVEFISGRLKYCLWLKSEDIDFLKRNPFIANRLQKVSEMRMRSSKAATQAATTTPHLFFECRQEGNEEIIAIPAISSENREYLPVGVLPSGTIITGKMYGIFNAPLWSMALLASRLHWVWIGTVCVRMRTDFSYSNTLGWNTFPLPILTEKNKSDLSNCAKKILLAREVHYPASIADLYEPEKMPDNLREAHEQNDEVLERIYIGRRFKNDTERLEKLFDLYTQMTQKVTNE